MAHPTTSNVGETSTTSGTGALALSAAITGMIRFNAIPGIATNDTVPYSIFSVDGSGNRTSEWEYGIGTYSAANTLTRTTVLGSSNAGAAVSFSGATLYVFLSPLGQLIPQMAPDSLVYARTLAGALGIVPQKYIIRADATRTFTSNTSEQAIFTSPANGRLTLPVGTYLFEGLINVGSMSATSGNAAIDILGAGTATAAAWLWHAVGVDGNTATAANQTGSTTVTQQSAASIVSAGTGTAMTVRLRGTFEVTGAGTLIPSLTMVTAAASVLAIGSYLEFQRIGDTSLVSIGPWD